MPEETKPQLNDPAGAPGQPSDEIDLLDYLEVLLKRKMLIVKITGAAIVLSVVCSLLLPKIYSATALVLPPQQDQGLMGLMLGQAGGGWPVLPGTSSVRGLRPTNT